MTRPCLPSSWASASTWWKPVILSMQAPPSGFMVRFARISPQKQLLRRSWSSCSSMVCLQCSPSTVIRRSVGSASGRDFPSAFVRFLFCLGIQPNICPPHRPDKNCYVERLHRTYKSECLLIHRPATVAQVREVTEAFMIHYNTERPHQGRSCNNIPPRVAFPTLPPCPQSQRRSTRIAGSRRIDGQAFARSVRADGSVTIDDVRYYVSHQLAGQRINLVVHAPDNVFDLLHGATRIKRMPIKGHDAQAVAFRRICGPDATRSTLRWASTDAEVSGAAAGEPMGVSARRAISAHFHTTPTFVVWLAAAPVQKAAVMPCYLHCCCWVIFRSSSSFRACSSCFPAV